MKIEKLQNQREAEVPEELPQNNELTGTDFDLREVCQGFKTWHNPNNGFAVGRLHYSADPVKRGAEWKRKARQGLTWAEWMREYEIVWSSFEGVPVYGDDFSRAFHVSKEALEWQRGYPVVRGWDFGLGAGGMACVFAQLLSHSRLYVYREVLASDTDIEHFAPEVKRLSAEWFPNCVKWFDIADATGVNRNQINKRSCYDVLRSEGMTPQPGEISIVKRRQAVTKFLQGAKQGQPKLLLDSEGCPTLLSGFEGGYCYTYAKDGQLREAAEKNEYSHPHDALQMICSRVDRLPLRSTASTVTIGGPRYGFGEQPIGAMNGQP